MSGACKYSNLFGEPGKGAHALRAGGLAVVDLLATGGLAFLVSRYGCGRTDLLAFVLVFIILMLVAVLVHEMFCVNTRLNAAIFGREWPGTPSGGSKAEHCCV
jgi:hypothetical protein